MDSSPIAVPCVSIALGLRSCFSIQRLTADSTDNTDKKKNVFLSFLSLIFYPCYLCHPWLIFDSSGVFEQAAPHHAVAFEKLLNPLIERALGLEAGLAQALIGDDVISLVRILSDCREMDVEVGNIVLDLQGQFFLGQVGVVQSEVVRDR